MAKPISPVKDHIRQSGSSGSAVSVAAVACGILLAGRLSLETLMWMGYISVSRKTALTLAALASLSYVICGPVLQKTPLTNRLGHLLLARVLNARQNWELDTLRSFCEVSIWLLVVWSTYVGTDGGCFGLIAALTLGTAAGAALVVLGELLQQPLRNIERALKETSSSRHMKGDMEEETFVSANILLLVLFGPSALSTIYENCTDLMVLASILVLGGATILAAARLCQAWRPTRHLGNILQARILNTSENWRLQPARSALESTFFTAVVMGVYELHGDALFALQTGFLSGMSIVIATEVFAHGINFDIKEDDAPSPISREMSVRPVILGYVSFMVMVCVYAQGHQAVNSAALSVIINSLLWVMMGRFSTTGIFQDLGTIINKRAIEASKNWTKYPVRSAGECAAWLCGQYVGYCWDSLVAGALLGTAAGVSAVLCSEAVEALLWRSQGRFEAKKAKTPNADARWTWEEVEKHATAEDAWLVIDGRVYDVTDFAANHPGGNIIYTFAGVDASDQFAAFHRPRVYGRLPQYLIGEVIEDEGHLPSKVTMEYRALRKQLWKDGWFKPDPFFYAGKGAVCVTLFCLAIGMATSLPASWSFSRTILSGVVLGIAWQQIAFMAHDADHYGIMTPRSGSSFNPLAWCLASVFFGISRCMWNEMKLRDNIVYRFWEEHSLHHAITLRPQEDPQFNYLPLWLISKKELDVPGTRVDFLTRCLVSEFISEARAGAKVSTELLFLCKYIKDRFALYLAGVEKAPEEIPSWALDVVSTNASTAIGSKAVPSIDSPAGRARNFDALETVQEAAEVLSRHTTAENFFPAAQRRVSNLQEIPEVPSQHIAMPKRNLPKLAALVNNEAVSDSTFTDTLRQTTRMDGDGHSGFRDRSKGSKNAVKGNLGMSRYGANLMGARSEAILRDDGFKGLPSLGYSRSTQAMQRTAHGIVVCRPELPPPPFKTEASRCSINSCAKKASQKRIEDPEIGRHRLICPTRKTQEALDATGYRASTPGRKRTVQEVLAELKGSIPNL